MEVLFIIAWTIAWFLIGWFVARLRIVHRCLHYGGFKYKEYYFRSLVQRADDPKNGEPEALKDFPSSEPLFAESTLDKVKFLNDDDKAKLLTAEKIALKLEGKGVIDFESNQEVGCFQCFSQVRAVPSCLVVCTQCGERHCDKLKDHVRLY